MRWVILFIVVLILVVIQTSLLMPFSLWGVRPDLILIVIVTVALTKGPIHGAVVGLFSGLFIDLLSGHMIGLGALVKGFVGLAVGFSGGRMFWDNAFVPIALVFAASLLEGTLYFIGAKAFGVNFYFVPAIARVLLPGAWYDALVAVVLYPLFSRLIHAVDKYLNEKSDDVTLGRGGGNVRSSF